MPNANALGQALSEFLHAIGMLRSDQRSSDALYARLELRGRFAKAPGDITRSLNEVHNKIKEDCENARDLLNRVKDAARLTIAGMSEAQQQKCQGVLFAASKSVQLACGRIAADYKIELNEDDEKKLSVLLELIDEYAGSTQDFKIIPDDEISQAEFSLISGLSPGYVSKNKRKLSPLTATKALDIRRTKDGRRNADIESRKAVEDKFKRAERGHINGG